MNNKIYFIDWMIFVHRSIFAWRNRKNIPATYTCLAMIIGCLKQLFLSPDDIVIIAADSRNSWRKKLDSAYKANRKEKREEYEDIDWSYWFKEFDNLLCKLELSTPFYKVKVDTCEADDIISVGVRLFKDKECIVISTDGDFEQLCSFPNVKLFSPVSKKWKIVKNPYKSLAKKIEQEKTDNLTSPILNDRDYKIRYSIVSLLELPKEIEEKIKPELEKLGDKDYDLEKIPFSSLRQRFMEIYNQTPKIKKSRKKTTLSCVLL